MSKAFTRESDHAEETPLLRRQLPPGIRNLITREGADRLRSKLEGLLQERQASATAQPESVRDEQAQRQQLDSSIRNLQAVLSSVVIAEAPVDRSKVGFGAAVVVGYPDGHQETFRIVGIDEADPERGAISWLSPLAKALVSKRPGDQVQFRGEELRLVDLTY